MQRLNHHELDNKIQSFMTRKLEEFPELRDDETAVRETPDSREHTANYKATTRFALRWPLSRAA
jgi:hypothetical protein